MAGRGGQYCKDLKSDTGSVEGIRTVCLGDKSTAVLERWRQWRPGDGDGWIVSHDGNTPMRAKTLGEAISKLGKKYGVKVSAHSFRRTTSTQMVAAGIDVGTVARRGGHTREVMLAHYVGAADDKAAEAGAVLENRLVGQGMALDDYFVLARTSWARCRHDLEARRKKLKDVPGTHSEDDPHNAALEKKLKKKKGKKVAPKPYGHSGPAVKTPAKSPSGAWNPARANVTASPTGAPVRNAYDLARFRRAELRGRSELRHQAPIGRDLERRGVGGM